MPIYEYRCSNGHTFDVMQRFHDDPITVCEVCGAASSRVFHAPAVHFKGSGFYNTDYGTRNRSREKEASESSGDGTGSKDSKDSKDSGKDAKKESGSEKAASTSESGGSKSDSSGGDSKAKASSD